jgi:hypothetical protein
VDALAPDNGRRGSQRTPCRRFAALLGALAVAASLALTPAVASAAPEPAKAADSFVDSIGVNTHTYYSDTAYYSRFDLVKQRLAELGVRHIRENLEPERPDQYQRLNELAASGVKSTLILGDPENGAEGLEELVSILKTELRGSVDAVEGPNEFDARGGADWAPRLSDYQQRLYDAVKSDPSLAGLPVIGPSIVQRRNQESLGDISSHLDYGNIHSYPDGNAPESNLGSWLERAALNSGSKPVIATETGYHTALNSTGEQNPVSEEAMATYMPRLFLEYFRSGVARTFSYELLDQKPDPGNSEAESNFGLLHNDFSATPAFNALRNTIGILADPGPAFTPGTLDYSLSGDRSNLRQLLLQKRDGSFYLVLWRATSVWNPNSRTALAAPSSTVEVDFARSVKSAEEFVPNVSAAPTASFPSGEEPIAVEVGAKAVVVKVVPGANSKPGRIKLWLSKHSVPPGGRVAVKGRLPRQMTGHSLPVKIQRWSKRGWGTVGRSRSSKSGIFRKKLRVPAQTNSRASRLRVVARTAKPSKSVRLRIRD